MELPVVRKKIEHYNNITCYSSDRSFMNINLHKNEKDEFDDLLTVINRSHNGVIYINNIYSRNVFNKIAILLSNNNYKGKIILNLLTADENNCFDITYDLDNYRYINIEDLPSNVKIIGFSSNNKQNEFTTWAHNISKSDKLNLINYLDEDQKRIFVEQESVIIKFYKDIIAIYPNIMNYSNIDRFKIIYDYFNKKYPYAYECLNSQGNGVKFGYEWSQDAIETFKRGRGVCEGRSNLLTLVTNNPLLNLRCVTAEGKLGTTGHAWNQFITDNNDIRNYDLSFNRFRDVSFDDAEKYNHTYDRLYPCVLEIVKKNRIQKKPLKINKRFKPLPKDLKDTE